MGCVCATAKRRRKQAKLDKRYKNWRKSAGARDQKAAKKLQEERERIARGASKK